MNIQAYSQRLNLRDELILEWKLTPEHDHSALSRICVELQFCFETRGDWQRKHRFSYAYAIAKGVIPRHRNSPKRGVHLADTRSADMDSRQKKLAEARDLIHFRCLKMKNGFAIEREAGEVLRDAASKEFPVNHCIKLANERVDYLMKFAP